MGSDLAHGHTIGWGQSSSPEFLIPSPLCFMGPNRGHLLDSGPCAAPDLPAEGSPAEGRRACVRPVSAAQTLAAALPVVCPPFPVTSPAPGLESCPFGGPE